MKKLMGIIVLLTITFLGNAYAKADRDNSKELSAQLSQEELQLIGLLTMMDTGSDEEFAEIVRELPPRIRRVLEGNNRSSLPSIILLHSIPDYIDNPELLRSEKYIEITKSLLKEYIQINNKSSDEKSKNVLVRRLGAKAVKLCGEKSRNVWVALSCRDNAEEPSYNLLDYIQFQCQISDDSDYYKFDQNQTLNTITQCAFKDYIL